jgi:hypothetical protein
MTDVAAKTVEECRFEISLTDVRQWAGILEDDNPLHEAAGGAVVPGPAVLAFVFTAVRRLFPSHRVGTISSRFTATVEAPAVITVRLARTTPSVEVDVDLPVSAMVTVNGREVFKSTLKLVPAVDGPP